MEQHTNSTQKFDFPLFVPVSQLVYNGANDLPPLMVPLQGGLTFLGEGEEDAVTAVEIAMMSLLIALPPSQVQIFEFDFSINKKFEYLYELRNALNKYKYVTTPRQAELAFQELLDLARYRHRELLSREFPTLYDFNANISARQPYIFVLLNLPDFPIRLIEPQTVRDFVDHAFEAGIIIFAYANLPDLGEQQLAAVQPFLERYPEILLKRNAVEIKNFDLFNQFNWPPETLDPKTLKLLPLSDDREKILQEFHRVHASPEEELAAESDFLQVPVGTTLDGLRSVEFRLGKGSEAYHAIIVGNTGTGKTTLINNLLLGIAERYTAKEIQLYLMDYKEGVEFQKFTRHPNVKKVFLDNKDFEAAYNLLKNFSELIEERGKLFRQLGVRDIDEYNQLAGEKPLPRVVLVIDEVQKLFSPREYHRSQAFDELLQDVTSRGRGFGIHVIISTQSIQNMDISQRTLEQIALRISFKLSTEQAVYKIFPPGNLAPLRLGKYEFVYNPRSGDPQANVLARASKPMNIDEIIERAWQERQPDEAITPEVVLGTGTGEGAQKESASVVKEVRRPSAAIEALNDHIQSAEARNKTLQGWKSLLDEVQQFEQDQGVEGHEHE
ncbi:FtsK/SpoIIIE domain-containing protein [Oceanithermus sp.]